MLPRIVFLQEDEQGIVQSLTRRWAIRGPGHFYIPLFHKFNRRRGITLGPTEYLRVENRLTGGVHNVHGPTLFFAGPDDICGEPMPCIPLTSSQYLRLQDRQTGAVRVVRGECTVCPEPNEVLLDGPQDGVFIDSHTAAMVRDLQSGQLRLETTPQVFVPNEHEELVEVRDCVLLAEHETVVVRDQTGHFTLQDGQNRSAFFLQPHEELVAMQWSTGIHKDERTLSITHIDSRPKYMWYEFEVRTHDNVELVVSITIFMQIVDVESMIRTTADTTGDICSHARSAIIQSVSRVALGPFLADFNNIVQRAVLKESDPFYANRGICIHAVEVRAISCKDDDTQQILQEIIREATDRLNRLQKQESRNEIKLKAANGEIAAEQVRRKLLAAQRENSAEAARIAGTAEAERVLAFFSGLGDDLATGDKLTIYNLLRKQEALATVSEGSAQVYFTPADVDLSIEARPPTNGNPVVN